MLTLLHELGHAFAARATGAHAEISLDFMAGYASFVPTRPLKRWERAGISLAGPAVQIGVSLAMLAASWASTRSTRASFTDSPASLAIWWAGPVIGLFNLLPILPLDGGHIVQAGARRGHPRHGRSSVMLYFSLAVTGTVGSCGADQPAAGHDYAVFVLFPLLVAAADAVRRQSTRASERGSLAAQCRGAGLATRAT